jgi:NAD-dependent deacetylase
MAPVGDAAEALETAKALLGAARRVVVLTGAGISTDSGIPDFRGPNGVWTRDPEAEKLSTIEHYLAEPDVRRRAWLRRLDNPAWVAEPNIGHHALVALERAGRMSLLITQNIDGLHVEAGNDPERVVEVHGTVTEAMCVRCDWRGPMPAVLDRVRAGEADPPCEECGGILKSSTVFFGESLDPEDLDRSFAAVETCDLLLTVGTSLQVYPIAGVVPRAMAAGAGVVIVNDEPTPYDDLADAVLRGSISEVLPALVGR